MIEKDEEQMNGEKTECWHDKPPPNPNGESDIIGNFKLLSQLFKSEKGMKTWF